LARDAKRIAAGLGAQGEAVLLGSISTDKYATVLLEHFGLKLKFPIDFIGRGDMSRGGLLLRRAREGTELEYTPVAGGVRRGVRPPKLGPQRPRLRDLHARFSKCCEAIEEENNYAT
jgi:hypothetical protein